MDLMHSKSAEGDALSAFAAVTDMNIPSTSLSALFMDPILHTAFAQQAVVGPHTQYNAFEVDAITRFISEQQPHQQPAREPQPLILLSLLAHVVSHAAEDERSSARTRTDWPSSTHDHATVPHGHSLHDDRVSSCAYHLRLPSI